MPAVDSDEVAEIFAEAVATFRAGTGSEEYDPVRPVLLRVVDADELAFPLAVGCLSDRESAVRATACGLLDVLSDRYEHLRGDAAAALIALAATEIDSDVQWAIARALGATCDARTMTTLVALAGHADSDVRFQAAMSLSSILSDHPDDAGVAALIRLCADDDAEVRNWATFGLGWITAIDGDDVREALWQRTTDSYSEAREEAIRGLARRRVPAVLPLLTELLAADDVHVHTFYAAELLGHPSLVPLLEEFERGVAINGALRECDPIRRAHRDNAAMIILDAVRAQRPDLDITVFGERCEPGLLLAVFSGVPSRESRRWRVENLLDRADGDPQLAAPMALADLTEPQPTAAG
jgi:HEAT repeats